MEKEIEEFVSKNPDWYVEDGHLVSGFEFKDFGAVKAVVNEVMNLAEEHNHHPTVTFGYNTVEVKTVTHDEGNSITEKDFKLAEAISKVVSG